MAKQKKKDQNEKSNMHDASENIEAEILEKAVDEDSASEAAENSEEEPSEIELELEQARTRAEENMDGWQRAQAEFANYKKRIERDRISLHIEITANVLKRYLEVVDDLDRAMENCPEAGDGAEWAAGIELIYRKFMTILENEGISQMQAEGEQFDPNLHEAIAQEDSPDHESGQIIEVINKGYLIGERVLRPALVRIAS